MSNKVEITQICPFPLVVSVGDVVVVVEPPIGTEVFQHKLLVGPSKRSIFINLIQAALKSVKKSGVVSSIFINKS